VAEDGPIGPRLLHPQSSVFSQQITIWDHKPHFDHLMQSYHVEYRDSASTSCNIAWAKENHEGTSKKRNIRNSTMNRHQYIVALHLASASTISHAIPLHIGDGKASLAPFSSSSELGKRDLCVVVGNPDLYGLWVRLGVYNQLTSSLLANNYHEELLNDAWDTVSKFGLSCSNITPDLLIEHDIRRCSIRGNPTSYCSQCSIAGRSIHHVTNALCIFADSASSLEVLRLDLY
jgi:hypothetical protein